MKTEILNVKGMSCSHCERAINEAVGELEGVSDVRADVKSNTVTVSFFENIVTIEKIKDVISEEGYVVIT
jgi:copper ion binding protein